MIIIGAKGHAKELIDVISYDGELCFFDDVSVNLTDKLFGIYPILRSREDVKEWFRKDNRFVPGVGNPVTRFRLTSLFKEWGGELTSVISANALIGRCNVRMGKGLNVMHQVVISNDVSIGEGSLINTASSIHHDVIIGQYCEISPAARILGGVEIGKFCSVGTGAIILPKVKVGDHVIIGAGAIVTKDVADNSIIAGNPAKPMVGK